MCIINPRIFNWRNLPVSMSMCRCVPVYVRIHGHGHGQGHINTLTSFVRHCWWGELQQHDLPVSASMCPCVPVHIHFHGILFSIPRFVPFGVLSHSAFYFIQRFVPFGVFSIRRFFHSTFCPIRRFFHSTFWPIRRFFSIRRFVPLGVLSFDFVGEPYLGVLRYAWGSTGTCEGQPAYYSLEYNNVNH